MKKSRKHYTPEEKVAILRRRLLEKEPISKLCDELGLQPTVFYEKKIQTKDEVLAELMAEHVALKKNAWGTLPAESCGFVNATALIVGSPSGRTI